MLCQNCDANYLNCELHLLCLVLSYGYFISKKCDLKCWYVSESRYKFFFKIFAPVLLLHAGTKTGSQEHKIAESENFSFEHSFLFCEICEVCKLN